MEGSAGAEICTELAVEPGDGVVTKHRHSAFLGTDLDIVLCGRHVRTILITGLATGSCVLSTARDAMALGYRAVVVADACGAGGYPDKGWGEMSGDEVHRVALTVLAATTCAVVSLGDLRTELGAARRYGG